jgi:hypothetical protein
VAREQRRRSEFDPDSRADTDKDAGGGADQHPCGTDRYSDADADQYPCGTDRYSDADADQYPCGTDRYSDADAEEGTDRYADADAYARATDCDAWRRRFCSAELDDHISAEWAGDSIGGPNHHDQRE